MTPEQRAQNLVDEGNACEDAGRLQDALRCYDTAIGLMPSLARAHLNRGNALLALDDHEAALGAYAAALDHDPKYAAAHYNVGNVCLRTGHHDAALAAYRRALALKPDFADAAVALGALHEGLGQMDEAAACYRQALGTAPKMASAHYGLGNALQKLGHPHEAIASYRRALDASPDFAEALSNLGGALIKVGQADEGLASFRSAVEARPGDAKLHFNLAAALRDTGNLDEAIESYRMALQFEPNYADAHYNLGDALLEAGRPQEAADSFRRAQQFNPDSAEATLNLGVALQILGEHRAAMENYERVLKLKPDHVYALSNLGDTLRVLGRIDEAIASCRRALEIDPDFSPARSNMLFIHNYRARTRPDELLAEARRFGEHVARHARPATAWRNVADPSRALRVGFVSGDLRNHPVGYLAEAPLAALASEFAGRLEIFVYANRAAGDEVTARIKAFCHRWRTVWHLSDEALAATIRGDAIDILIDLSGHTAYNRLPMFAWKPAPVQATWIGYFATTGVTAIDYFIADPWTLPAEEEVHFTETIWRLPETRLCFTPPNEDVATAPPRASGSGRVTFGCFNNLAKVNDDVVALWARILAAVPQSTLLLKARQLQEPEARAAIIERFSAHGIAGERLLVEGPASRADYLATYNRVDIALDPFPYTGGMTTAEALWMGVPVLTLAGSSLLSRQGVGLLMNASLPDWIAVDPDDYVARAVAHAADAHRLAGLRAGLRGQVMASPLFDAPRFASHFEAALRSMWQRWCAENAPKS